MSFVHLKSQARVLYPLVGVLALFVWLTATGGGIFGYSSSWITEWQHQAFRTLCHQDPGRSFWIGGQPMAVCSRCYGIYSAFGIFWLMMPLSSFIPLKIHKQTKNVLLIIILLNIGDVIGNMMGFWQNTLITRYLLGAGIGFASVLFLADTFITINLKIKRDAYGIERRV